MNTDFKAVVRNKIWYILRDYFYFQRVADSPCVLNLNIDNSNQNQKKALICYLPYGYFFSHQNINIGRTIHNEIFEIVKVFSELDYRIDIVDCNEVKSLEIIQSNTYDLIFGFGETFYQMAKKKPHAISILYMTENHPSFSLDEETKRNDYFYARHSKKLKTVRSGMYYKIKHLEIKYSHVITLSETGPLKIQYTAPFSIYPTGIINPNYLFKNKDQQFTKNNFLWLGSDGAIHKGLDLLIDVFKDRKDIVLHICGLSNTDRKILNLEQRANIIEYGQIDIKSNTFLHIVDLCSFIILPSCSEGFSTSITTGMLHGLIPIVMKNVGFDRLNDQAIFLKDYKIDYLNDKLTEIANLNPDDLKIWSKKVYDFAHMNFSISNFTENFKRIICEVTGLIDNPDVESNREIKRARTSILQEVKN